MKNILTFVILPVIALLLTITPIDAQTTGRFPKLSSWVTDYAHLLSTNEEYQLTEMISDYEKRSTTEIAVVILNSIKPETNINIYATALFNHVGIGKRDKNNGILFLVALKDRSVRLEIGLGLEKTIPDDIVGAILDEHVIPMFKKDRYAEGILAGVTAVIQRLEEGQQPPAPRTRSPDLREEP